MFKRRRQVLSFRHLCQLHRWSEQQRLGYFYFSSVVGHARGPNASEAGSQGCHRTLYVITKHMFPFFAEVLMLIRTRCANGNTVAVEQKKVNEFPFGVVRGRDATGAIFRTTDCEASQTFPRKRARPLFVCAVMKITGDGELHSRVALATSLRSWRVTGRESRARRARPFVLQA